MMIKNIVLLSTADWDNPWTNKQHVSVELARMGIKVFILTIRPEPSGIKKVILNEFIKDYVKLLTYHLIKWIIWVWSPIILPWHKYALIRVFNKVYLRLYLKFHFKEIDISR